MAVIKLILLCKIPNILKCLEINRPMIKPEITILDAVKEQMVIIIIIIIVIRLVMVLSRAYP